MSDFNLETFFEDQINRHCDMPAIEPDDAFALYYAAGNLVSALADLRRLVPKYGTKEITKLVRSIGSRTGESGMAANVVGMIGITESIGPRIVRQQERAASRQ